MTTVQPALGFELREIDRDKTRDRVEQVLEACRMYMQIGCYPAIEPRTVAAYDPALHNPSASTEDVAIRNVDEEMRRAKLIRSVVMAVKRLTRQEAELIVRRYLDLDEEDTMDYLVWEKMNISQRKYYKVKSKAFYKLGLAMNIEVYVDAEQSA